MKTLLLRPFVDSTQGISPPIALMYLSSYLRSKEYDVRLIDNIVDIKSISGFSSSDPYIKGLFREIDDYGPDLIGMTLFSRELKYIADVCKAIKEGFRSVYIILGGPHVTAMPTETLEAIPDCDFASRGESEIILYDLVTCLANSGDLEGVNGISFRDGGGGEVHQCKDAQIIKDLNSLPLPDRESLIENYLNRAYSSLLYGSPSDCIMTSRGCPYQCYFCFKVCNKYRGRSPEDVLAEIDWSMENISPQCIQIMDDSFTIQRDRCEKILDALIEREYPLRIKVRSRVDAVDEELLRKMKRAGVETVVFGFESGSQRMLEAFNKSTTVEQNINACRMTRKADLNCLGDMILFYPGENRETLKETEQFLRTAKPTAVKFYVLTPLPNTQVYNDAKEDGTLVGDWTIDSDPPWVRTNEFNSLEEMERIAKSMFLKTMLSPYRIIWALKTAFKAFIRNPSMAIRMVFYALSKKIKY